MTSEQARAKASRNAAALGRLGGKASAARLTPEERVAKGKAAIAARWARVRALRLASE